MNIRSGILRGIPVKGFYYNGGWHPPIASRSPPVPDTWRQVAGRRRWPRFAGSGVPVSPAVRGVAVIRR